MQQNFTRQINRGTSTAKSYTSEDFESLEGRASKSEQKRAVQRMAALGEQLAELSEKQIRQLPVEDRLIDALLDVREITSFEARRRQFQRIGKLLRNEDEAVILSYLTPKQGLKQQALLTRWVDRLIEQGDAAVHEFSKNIMPLRSIHCVSMCFVTIAIKIYKQRQMN